MLSKAIVIDIHCLSLAILIALLLCQHTIISSGKSRGKKCKKNHAKCVFAIFQRQMFSSQLSKACSQPQNFQRALIRIIYFFNFVVVVLSLIISFLLFILFLLFFIHKLNVIACRQSLAVTAKRHQPAFLSTTNRLLSAFLNGHKLVTVAATAFFNVPHRLPFCLTNILFESVKV